MKRESHWSLVVILLYLFEKKNDITKISVREMIDWNFLKYMWDHVAKIFKEILYILGVGIVRIFG